MPGPEKFVETLSYITSVSNVLFSTPFGWIVLTAIALTILALVMSLFKR